MEFKDGVACGYWKYYDEDGQLVREVNMNEWEAKTEAAAPAEETPAEAAPAEEKTID